MPAPKKYDEETQARAVRMYRDRLAEGDIAQRAAREEVGALLGFNAPTLRNWIRREFGEGVTPAGANAAGDDVRYGTLSEFSGHAKTVRRLN